MTATFARRCAEAGRDSRPMPEPPPVTTATRLDDLQARITA